MVLPRTFIIGLIAFMFVITASVSLISIAQTKNPDFIDGDKYPQFNATFNKVDELNESIYSLKETIIDAPDDVNILDVFKSIGSSAKQSIKLIFSSFTFAFTLFDGLYDILGIPAWVGNFIILIIVVVLVFSLFAIIFKRDF